MTLEQQIILAVILDLIIGDPRWLPHPVKLIGKLIGILEDRLRSIIGNQRAAGTLMAVVVIAVTGGVTFAAIRIAAWFHPWAADLLSVLFIYTALSIRDLGKHSMDVYRALQAGNLPQARAQVALIVGRDTGNLDEKGVIRAAVESVAENTVDGIIAPLFFTVLFGAVGALMYKATSTLDSMVGYKNEKYFHFGWASARLDDAANFLPARLTAPLMFIGAFLTGYRPLRAWRVCLRDSSHHASPNSGIPEAAMAGALGIQLGGPLLRSGKEVELPFIGDRLEPMERRHILQANYLMLITSLLAVIIFVGIRFFVKG
ncbi:MAG: adenosylcobinamide-phosphate synthase CbiB [Smithellaceae bacterium]